MFIRVHSWFSTAVSWFKGSGLSILDYDEDEDEREEEKEEEEGQRPRRGDPPRLAANAAPAPLVPSAGRYATRRATPVTNCLYGVIGQVAGVDVGTSRRADPDQSPSPARLSR